VPIGAALAYLGETGIRQADSALLQRSQDRMESRCAASAICQASRRCHSSLRAIFASRSTPSPAQWRCASVSSTGWPPR
jgi:hypothetical protein